MRKLIVFNNVTLDGYFTDANGDMSWAHGRDDAEFGAFVQDNAKGGGELLFGRITYELMAGYWPTPRGLADNPVVAKAMNERSKTVFSRTLKTASWSNTMLVNGDPAAEIRRMKNTPGKDLVILGSGSIVALLAGEGLIDEYQIALNPIALGAGRSMFDGIPRKLSLKLTQTRAFRNGCVFLRYEP